MIFIEQSSQGGIPKGQSNSPGRAGILSSKLTSNYRFRTRDCWIGLRTESPFVFKGMNIIQHKLPTLLPCFHRNTPRKAYCDAIDNLERSRVSMLQSQDIFLVSLESLIRCSVGAAERTSIQYTEESNWENSGHSLPKRKQE